MVKNECEHGKGKYKCRICNPTAFCEHENYKYSCRTCNPEMKNKKKLELNVNIIKERIVANYVQGAFIKN